MKPAAMPQGQHACMYAHRHRPLDAVHDELQVAEATCVRWCSRCAGVCCAHELDADRSCCPAGVDACGVCGGDGSGCFGRAALPLAIDPPANTSCTAAAFADAGSWCALARADFCDALIQSLALAPAAAGVAPGAALDCDVAAVEEAGAARRRRLMQGGEEAALGMALEVELRGPRGMFSESALVLLAATSVPGVASRLPLCCTT